MDISILIVCILLSFVIRALFGLSAWVLLGSIFFITFLLPAFLSSPLISRETVEDMANQADLYVATLIKALPSMIVGELVGIFLKDILMLPKVIFDHVKGLF